jgi:hypothetical protein
MPLLPRERLLSKDRQRQNQILLKAALMLSGGEGERETAREKEQDQGNDKKTQKTELEPITEQELQRAKQALKEIIHENEFQSLLGSVIKKLFHSNSNNSKTVTDHAMHRYVDCNANFLSHALGAVGIAISPKIDLTDRSKGKRLVDSDGIAIDSIEKHDQDSESDSKELTVNKIMNRQVSMSTQVVEISTTSSSSSSSRSDRDSVRIERMKEIQLVFDPESVLVRTS